MLKTLKFLFLGLVFVLIAVGTYQTYRFFIPIEGPQINLDRAAVIKKITRLQRLETTTFLMDKIVDANIPQDNPIGEFLFGDKLILIAHGQVIAGFDLSQVQDKDIEISDKGQVYMKLPKAQILVTRLDETQTKVYDRQTGIFARPDKDLESQARVAAEKSLRTAACEGGIIAEAELGVRQYFTTMMTSLGFTEVIIEIPRSSAQDCTK